MHRRHAHKGFTLLELMVAVAVIGILATVGVPSYRAVIAKAQVRAAATEIYVGLVRARSEAIKLNTAVRLEPNGTAWESGWVIKDPAATTTQLAVSNSFKGITVRGVASGTPPASVEYQSSGRITPVVTAPYFLIASTKDSSVKYCVAIDLSGRPSTVQGTTC